MPSATCSIFARIPLAIGLDVFSAPENIIPYGKSHGDRDKSFICGLHYDAFNNLERRVRPVIEPFDFGGCALDASNVTA